MRAHPFNSDDARLSVARMRSPGGWEEPGQRPEFLEVTCVLSGAVHVEHATGKTIVSAGQCVISSRGGERSPCAALSRLRSMILRPTPPLIAVRNARRRKR